MSCWTARLYFLLISRVASGSWSGSYTTSCISTSSIAMSREYLYDLRLLGLRRRGRDGEGKDNESEGAMRRRSKTRRVARRDREPRDTSVAWKVSVLEDYLSLFTNSL